MIAPEVAHLLEAVPEFTDHFRNLCEVVDGDPGAAATFIELAEFVAGSLANDERSGPLVDRCLDAVEVVAMVSPDAEELVGWAFLGSLCPVDLDHIWAGLGPRTLSLASALELGSPTGYEGSGNEP